MMPVLFAGHGSPMNAIEDNRFTKGWRQMAESIPRPKGILCISAHWETEGTKVSTVENPKTIHDFYGFPKELFEIQYPAKGSPELARETRSLLGDMASGDKNWGLDHGAWSVLRVMYPEADIPVVQLSLDYHATREQLFEIGKRIGPLREKEILILGSGNIVHNLRILDYSLDSGFDWAVTFDDYITQKIMGKDFLGILNHRCLADVSRLSVPTTEHFNPLLVVLGAVNETDEVKIYNKACMAGSISMTSYVFG